MRRTLRRILAASVVTLIMVAVADAQRGGGGGGGGGGLGGGGFGGQGGGARGATGGRGAQPQDPNRQRPKQDDTPTFRSKVTVVEIDAIVTDAAGNVVKGLKQEDFEVLEAGHPREISTFAAVDIPLPSPETTSGQLESDLVTNASPPGRTYLIALDEVDPPNALKARHFLRDFVERYMGPSDLAAVSLTGRGLASSAQDFTSNKRLILAAIDKFSGGFAPFEAGGAKNLSEDGTATKARVATSDTRQLGSSLRALTQFLATMPGRKVMLYVGEGLGGLDAYSATSYKGTTLSPGERDFHEAMAAATRGNVTIYPIDPRGLTTDTTESGSFDTSDLDARADLAAVADVTGGFSLTGSNNTGHAFERLVSENSAYYTLGFASENERLDGRFVSVQVHVKRPGLTVRSRNGYVAPMEKEAARATVDSNAKMPTIQSALGSAIATSDVTMRVVATPFKGANNTATVALAIEFDVSKLDLVETNGVLSGDIEVSFIATDVKGKVHPGRRYSSTLSLKKEAADVLFTKGMRIVTDIELPRGRYQLRVAAGSHSRAGSVVYDLEVPDFGDGLQLSGVSLTSATSNVIGTQKATDPLGKALPGPPIALRDFARQDTVALYVEAYDLSRKSQLPLLTADLRTADGKVIGKLPDQKQASSLHADQGAIGLTAAFPLSGLQPGVYLVHIEAKSDNGKDVRQREIPIRVW